MSRGKTSRRLLLFFLAVAILGCVLGAEDTSGKEEVKGSRKGGYRRGGKRVAGRRKTGTHALGAKVHPDPYPCRPRMQSVPLPPAPPRKFYVPSCAVVKRCSGCCSIDAIECIPKAGVKEAKVKWETNEYMMESNGRLKFNGVVSFKILEHTKCTCGCKVRAEHCNNMQNHDPLNCRCNCNNLSESTTCEAPRFWDYSECTCRCPSFSIDCSTGTYMDPESCKCISGETIVKKVKAATKLGLPDIYRV